VRSGDLGDPHRRVAVEILVNSAGVESFDALLDITPETWAVRSSSGVAGQQPVEVGPQLG
jgi:hypothetical protein